MKSANLKVRCLGGLAVLASTVVVPRFLELWQLPSIDSATVTFLQQVRFRYSWQQRSPLRAGRGNNSSRLRGAAATALRSLCSGIRKYAVALTLVTVAISVTGQRSGRDL